MTSTASTPDVSGLLPGGYPGTPQHEQPVDENATNELGDYLQKIKQSLPSFPLNLNADDYNAESKDNTGNGPDREPKNMDENNAGNYDTSYYVEKIKESLPSIPLFNTGNNVEDNAENKENKEPRSIEDNTEENKDSGNYVEKIKESLPSNPLMSNTDNVAEDKESENKDTGNYVEKIKESLPSIPFTSNTDNNVAEDESENKDSGNYVEKIKESLPTIPFMSNTDNNVAEDKESENKDSGNYVEKIKESLPSNPLMSNTDNVAEDKESENIGNSSENKDSRTYMEKIMGSLPSFPTFMGESGPDAKAESVENKAENNNAEKSRDDKIREEFPLRYEPNPSAKVTDDDNLAKATNKGSSALGGIGINPAAITELFGSQSPRHPYYQEHPPEAEEKTDKTDTSHAHGTADQYQTSFDLTGDYNKQKEQEQIAEHKAKSAQQEQEQIAEHKAQQDKLDHKQKSEGKKPVKPERIDLGVKPLDLGVKPLGDQQPPLPYRPEGDPDRIKQSPSKGHSQEDLGPKITKKDKVNATVGKAVGTIKQKIGKIVRSDSLTAKGTEERAEAHKTKEFAELQKQAKEF